MKKENVQALFTPNKDDILTHLTTLFGDCRGYDDGKIEIAYTSSDSPAVNKAEFFDAIDLQDAADFAYRINSQQGVNVYVGAALRNPETPPFGRSSKEDFYAAYAVWVDLDDAEAAKNAKEKYKNLPPSLVVVTGREPNVRAQAWWKLQVPEQDTSLLNDRLSHVCAALSGDPAVVDPARVMRLGGTIAYPKKQGRITEKTEVIIPPNPTKMVNIDKFNSYFDIPKGAQTKTQVLTSFKAPLTGNFKIKELLENSKEEGQWHFSMRDAICSMVGRGWTNEQIIIATDPYRRDRSLVDDLITPLIISARQKYNHPEPSESRPIKEIVNPETGEVINKTKMYYLKGCDMEYQPDNNDFVQGLLEKGAMSVVYGESNCGKTFFMADLSYHIAQSKKWRDKRVEGGIVLYVALEGIRGLSGRIEAYKKETGADLSKFLVMPCSLDFLDAEGDIMEFIDLLKEIKETEGDVTMIVIDTLARAIGGGDENSGQDMGVLVNHADAIREISGAHICFVHHSGKDKAKGARGHSSLRAAVDTEIEISREEGADFSEVKIVKQREMEKGENLAFKLKSVNIGVNKYLEEKTSCVVVPCEIEQKPQTHKLSAQESFMYDCIVMAIDESGITLSPERGMEAIKAINYEDFYEALEARGYKELYDKDGDVSVKNIKSATNSVRIQLKKKAKIMFNGKYIWLV